MQTDPTRGVYRAATGRARAAQICLAALCLLAVIAAIHFLSGLDLAQRAALGRVRVGEATAFDSDTAVLARLSALGLIATGVVWFLWLHRAVANARALGRPTDFTPGWAVGWWFVPLANVVRPYQILRSLLDELGAPTNRPVLWWWGCYLAASVFTNFAGFLPVSDVNGLRVYLGSSLIGEALWAAAAILAFRLVGEIEKRSEDAAAIQASPEYGSAGSPVESPRI